VAHSPDDSSIRQFNRLMNRIELRDAKVWQRRRFGFTRSEISELVTAVGAAAATTFMAISAELNDPARQRTFIDREGNRIALGPDQLFVDRNALARDVGAGRPTVDTHIWRLQKAGLLEVAMPRRGKLLTVYRVRHPFASGESLEAVPEAA
jgi:biotin operon repressor